VCAEISSDYAGGLGGGTIIYRPKDLRRGFSGEFAREVCVVAEQRLGVAQLRAECRFLHQLCVGPRAHNTTALRHTLNLVILTGVTKNSAAAAGQISKVEPSLPFPYPIDVKNVQIKIKNVKRRKKRDTNKKKRL